jgi:hypothetical protein
MRSLAFGDLATGVWGAAWLPSAGDDTFAFFGGPEATGAATSARLEGERRDADWRVQSSGGTDLTVSSLGEAVEIAGADGALTGFEQLCRVRGRLAADDTEQEVDCLGRRAARTGPLDLERVDSVRDISAWFEPDGGLAVVALRPRGARGHDEDLITGAVIDPEGSTAVADPRFSTTYNGSGEPIRSSFELWLGSEEEEYPRRAAGEAVGPRASHQDRGLALQASLFRWHSRGHDGAGVYILARRP